MIVQRKIEKFRVIGSNARMQKISWDEEIELINGIPYMIDFSRDFSNVYIGRSPIIDLSINDITTAITPQMNDEIVFNRHALLGKEDHSGIDIWEEYNKIQENNREWRKDKKIAKKLEKRFWTEYWGSLFKERAF